MTRGESRAGTPLRREEAVREQALPEEAVREQALPEEAAVLQPMARDAGELETDRARPGTEIFVDNAGLVLAAPFLPRLFTTLDLVAESDFQDHAAVERAVHLLQYMVDETTGAPEYLLVLNKILCGLPTRVPISRGVELGEPEKETVENLLQAMIEHWGGLGNTSVAGLRESFLQRGGRLEPRDDAWHLLVEPRAFDMLLDRVPWNYRTIKLPWMKTVLYVDWR